MVGGKPSALAVHSQRLCIATHKLACVQVHMQSWKLLYSNIHAKLTHKIDVLTWNENNKLCKVVNSSYGKCKSLYY